MSDNRDELIDAATDDAERARLWHALIDDLTILPCKYPSLRDDLVGWLHARSAVPTTEKP